MIKVYNMPLYIWYPLIMSKNPLSDIRSLYDSFDLPISEIDCGKKCGPYNDYGVPFCCDIHHVVPTAYDEEWSFLKQHTDLWELYTDQTVCLSGLIEQLPEDRVLIKCLGYKYCQRNFRSFDCRAFPFFPYITLNREFIGMTYYWEYEHKCWLISHLGMVSIEYRNAFVNFFDHLFKIKPDEVEHFRYQGILMRRVFGKKKRNIPLLHRDGGYFMVQPSSSHLIPVSPNELPKFDPYSIIDEMKFPDE